MKTRRRSEYGTEIVSEDHRMLIKDLADYIVYGKLSFYYDIDMHCFVTEIVILNMSLLNSLNPKSGQNVSGFCIIIFSAKDK